MFTDTLTYPDWYITEKETFRTISNLYTMKELDFYLKSSNEYIRRLAIIRISELKLKDSIDKLKEFMDEPYESTANKELAAWAIKVVSKKWNIDLFISNKLLSRFTGSERLEDLSKIIFIDSLSSIKYEFSSELILKELKSDVNTYRQHEEVNLEIPFSLKDWAKSYILYTFAHLSNSLKGLPKRISNGLKILFLKSPKIILSTISSFTKNRSTGLLKNRKNRSSTKKPYESKHYYIQPHKSTNITTQIKNFIITVLYVTFFPVRMIIRHKALFICTLLASYCLLTLTVPGKILTYKYTGMDISEIQRNAFYSVKDFVSYALDEAKTLVGAYDTDSQADSFTDISPSIPIREFEVIAKDGLNLRTAPSSTSAKVVKDALGYGTVVIYEGSSKKDPAGRLWFLVRTPGGIAGWVNSKWLKERADS